MSISGRKSFQGRSRVCWIVPDALNRDYKSRLHVIPRHGEIHYHTCAYKGNISNNEMEKEEKKCMLFTSDIAYEICLEMRMIIIHSFCICISRKFIKIATNKKNKFTEIIMI